MLEESAKVVAVREGHLWVETESRSACSQCSRNSCTTSVISRLFEVRRNRLQLDNSLGAEWGGQVVIGIPDNLLVRASAWVYLLPLISMVMVTAVGNALDVSEGLQSLLALSGLTMGFILVRWTTRNMPSRQRFKPQLLRIVDHDGCRVERPNLVRSQP